MKSVGPTARVFKGAPPTGVAPSTGGLKVGGKKTGPNIVAAAGTTSVEASTTCTSLIRNGKKITWASAVGISAIGASKPIWKL